MNTILPLIYLQKCPSIMSQVVLPEICWIVITETWSLVYNPLLPGKANLEKEDISGKKIYLIMTNPGEQIT